MAGAEQLLSAVRVQLYAHPLVAVVAVSLALAVVGKAGAGFGRGGVGAGFSRPISSLPIAAYVLLAIGYLLSPAYWDHIEPAIAAVSWYHMTGAALYPPADAAAQYALPYGPVLYWVNGLTLKALGPSVLVSKLAGTAAALLSLVLVARAVDRRHRPALALVATVTVGYMAFGVMTFWTRSEPVLLALVAAALSQLSAGAGRQAIVLGIACGLACNVKVTAVLYFVPFAAHLAREHGVRALAGSCALGAAVFAAPFAAGAVSFGDYAGWLAATAEHGIRLRGLTSQVEWAMVLLFGGLGSDMRRWSSSPLRLAFVLAVLATVPAAAKLGAGAYHFIPFLPIAAYLRFAAEPDSRSEVSIDALRTRAVLLVAIVLGALQQISWIGTLRNTEAAAMRREVEEMARSTTRPVVMGYSADYRSSFVRPALVFAGHPYTLDAPALMDHQVSGITFPAAATDALRSCETAWILPKGDPFVLPNAYRPEVTVFPGTFRTAFSTHYRRTRQGSAFDLWECSR